MATNTVLEAIREALREEIQRDPNVILLGEDIGVMGGVFRATEGLLSEFGAEKVMDTPLAESAIVGVAVGAAVNGMRPVVEMQFGDFMYEATDQLISEAAKLRYRSNGDFHSPIVVRIPVGGGVHGALYHSQNVEALFSHVPGLKVVLPSTPFDAKGLLKSAIRDEDPVLFLEHKKTYRLIKGEVPEDDYTVPIGKADVKRPGSRMTVITYGYMVHLCLQAAAALAEEGIDVEVLDLRTLRPLDEDAIIESTQKTGRVLIVHEDNKTLGIGAEVAALIGEEAFGFLDAPVTRLAAPEVPQTPFSPPLEEFCLPSEDQIKDALRKLAVY